MGDIDSGEVLPMPPEHFQMSYCSYCVHERKAHAHDGTCLRCAADGNGFWPECVRFTRLEVTSELLRSRGVVPLAPTVTEGSTET